LRTDPHNLGAFEAAGALLLARGKLEESLECFHRITWENPAYPRVWRLNAKVFEALGATQNAAVCRDGGACVHS
jgi:predicted Zn-dependent protease